MADPTDDPGEEGAEQEPIPEGEAAAGEGAETAPPEEEEAAGDDDELVVSIAGAEPDPQDDKAAPLWVKDLRKSNREKDRVIRDLEAKLAAKDPAPSIIVGAEPTLEGCGYDTDKFKADWTSWTERKAKADDQQRVKADEERQVQENWSRSLQSYNDAKAKLKVKDFTDSENVVVAALSVAQQGILVDGTDRPDLVVYALGKPSAKAKLAEMAAIKNPIKFCAALVKLESQLKVTKRSAPAPEAVPRGGSGAGAATLDNELERLREEAFKTGDFTKVHAFKQQQRTKERQREA